MATVPRSVHAELLNLTGAGGFQRIINCLNGTSAADATEEAVGGQRSSAILRRPNWARGFVTHLLGYDDGSGDLTTPGFNIAGAGLSANEECRGQLEVNSEVEKIVYSATPLTDGQKGLSILYPSGTQDSAAYDAYTADVVTKVIAVVPHWVRFVIRTTGATTDLDCSLWLRWLA